MKRLKALLFLLVLTSAGVAAYVYMGRPPSELVLTGIVTTNDLIVSPQIGGRISDLKVVEGDVVKKDQLVAVIAPDELRADTAYYAHSAQGMVSQVRESEAALRLQERQTADQIKQAEANLAAAEAQQMAAVADLENAKLELDRSRNLSQKGVEPPQRYDTARTAYDAASAKLDSARKQVDSQKSSLSLANANAEQVAVRRSQVQTMLQQQQAANAQRSKAEVRLGYAEVRAPIDGIVDVRAMRVGEVINPGETIVTLINPDDLWIRADVEETYIDRVRLGDKMTIRLPSGETREGTVFFRGVDASFATQRDVSRTKRDIKTFEVRLRADNRDRRLALGMTAYVLLPLNKT
ncbi:MAG TPA: efflux RND transporter periplasmic adaptor subunit [Vicinamibacterales bacterium]|nr:efflux RND transporter periplasmic adaptor subunit [Vicinamibacterales bacterium]